MRRGPKTESPASSSGARESRARRAGSSRCPTGTRGRGSPAAPSATHAGTRPRRVRATRGRRTCPPTCGSSRGARPRSSRTPAIAIGRGAAARRPASASQNAVIGTMYQGATSGRERRRSDPRGGGSSARRTSAGSLSRRVRRAAHSDAATRTRPARRRGTPRGGGRNVSRAVRERPPEKVRGRSRARAAPGSSRIAEGADDEVPDVLRRGRGPPRPGGSAHRRRLRSPAAKSAAAKTGHAMTPPPHDHEARRPQAARLAARGRAGSRVARGRAIARRERRPARAASGEPIRRT